MSELTVIHINKNNLTTNKKNLKNVKSTVKKYGMAHAMETFATVGNKRILESLLCLISIFCKRNRTTKQSTFLLAKSI